MSRLNVITPERISPEQRKVYEESVAAGTPHGNHRRAIYRLYPEP